MKTVPKISPRRFSVAPMMDWTDRHDRYFLRLISRHAYLYTEMVTADAVIHGDRDHLIGFDAREHPVALQLGGCDPQKMAEAARIATDFGYDEININVGCPSDRVQSGQFGACLMAEPDLVAACVRQMRRATTLPITVKCRIGINDNDHYDYLKNFVQVVADAGCLTVIVHARVAILAGLSPKQNRDIPPLHYGHVHQLKADFPDLEILLNGGLGDHETALDALAQGLDGVMVGRQAYQDTYFLSSVDALYYGDQDPVRSRRSVIQEMLPYVDAHCRQGGRLNAITRHLHGLFAGQPGAKAWRRYLSENSYQSGRGAEVLEQALTLVPEPAQAMGLTGT